MTILDTDCYSEILNGNTEYARRFQAIDRNVRGVAIVTVEELLRGRLAMIRKFQVTGNPGQLEMAYRHLSETMTSFFDLTIFPYTPLAHEHYIRLNSQKLRIGTRDLRIASIALAHDATLITRNRRDFDIVPSLQLEVWN